MAPMVSRSPIVELQCDAAFSRSREGKKAHSSWLLNQKLAFSPIHDVVGKTREKSNSNTRNIVSRRSVLSGEVEHACSLHRG